MLCNENALVCNQLYSSVSFACFMNMCELPVIYHTLFVIILHLVTYNNIIMCFLCYSGWHKSLLTNVYHGNRKEPLCQYLDFVLLWLPDRWLFRITNSNCAIHDGSPSFGDIKIFIQNNFIFKFSYN